MPVRKSRKQPTTGKRAEFAEKCKAAAPEVVALIDKHSFGVVAHVVSKLKERERLKVQAAEVSRTLSNINLKIETEFF